MYHALGRSEIHAKYELEILRGRNSLGDIGVDGKKILKSFLKNGVRCSGLGLSGSG
jgi:hypothetical protein